MEIFKRQPSFVAHIKYLPLDCFPLNADYLIARIIVGAGDILSIESENDWCNTVYYSLIHSLRR